MPPDCRSRAYFPLLLALSPILNTLAANGGQVATRELVRPALILIVATLLAWALLARVWHSSNRPACLTGFGVFWLFCFGALRHVLYASGGLLLLESSVREWVPLTLWAIVGIFGLRIILYARISEWTTRGLNRLVLVMIVVPLFRAGWNSEVLWGSPSFGSPASLQAAIPTRVVGPPPANPEVPDVYLILLDGYGRADVIEELYGIGPEPLAPQLAARGFHVEPKAFTNYAQTSLVVASMLGLAYVHKDIDVPGSDSDDRLWLGEQIAGAPALPFFYWHGYQVVELSSGYAPTRVAPGLPTRRLGKAGGLSAVEVMLLNHTVLPRIMAWFRTRSLFDSYRQMLRQNMNHLGRIHRDDRPMFVFAHIMLPHPPFVFGADGRGNDPPGPFLFDDGSHWTRSQFSTRAAYRRLYGEQLRFAASQVIQAVDRILDQPGPEPVMILMSDHGPGSGLDWDSLNRTDIHERFSILSAVRLPGEPVAQPRSPINLLRFILRQGIARGWIRELDGEQGPQRRGGAASHVMRSVAAEFGLETLDDLEERAWFSLWDRPYDFVDVTREIQGERASVPVPIDVPINGSP